MNAFAKQLQDEEERMANAPRRQRARKEMERIQREAEERIKNIRQAVEVADKEQADRIANDRSELEATRRKAEELAQRVAAAMQSKAPLEVVRALQGIQQEREVDHILSRAHDRLPEAPLEKVLPLDAPPSLRGAPSASRPPTYHPNHVAGLNESYADQSTLNVFRRPPNVSAAPSPLPAKSKDASSINASDLYKRYIATAPQKGKARPATGTPVAQASGTQPSHSTRASSQASSVASSTVTSVRKVSSPDADLAKGWSLLRQGKEDEARAVWGRVIAQHRRGYPMGGEGKSLHRRGPRQGLPHRRQTLRGVSAARSTGPHDRLQLWSAAGGRAATAGQSSAAVRAGGRVGRPRREHPGKTAAADAGRGRKR
ncbi:hypothetical protein ADEAN_000761700 [Angomonas deanei]|uniref:Uncharacterized protein n=1 Tax=Angomonas deanei TaxID=59799 RepID=A0A7G2CPJ5_9TRYP|nr:hypothetical protein ADEAN_000761700 [Angomonas deanei]